MSTPTSRARHRAVASPPSRLRSVATLACLVVCTAVALGAPGVWWLTRPAAAVGEAVLDENAAPPTRDAASPVGGAEPAEPEPSAGVVGAPALPRFSVSSPTRAANPATSRPVRLVVRSVGLDAPIVPVGVERNGAMALPEDVDHVGWYRYGPPPATAYGSAVLAGHVDDEEQGLGVMARLRSVDVGARVVVARTGGKPSDFTVVSRERIAKAALPVEALFRREGPPRLVLITCGGAFDSARGAYEENLVVVAEPLL
jgi:hypothetical protein